MYQWKYVNLQHIHNKGRIKGPHQQRKDFTIHTTIFTFFNVVSSKLVVIIYVHTDYWYRSHRSYSHIMRHWLNGTRQNYKVNYYILNLFKVEIWVRNLSKYNVETNTTIKNIVKVSIVVTIWLFHSSNKTESNMDKTSNQCYDKWHMR